MPVLAWPRPVCQTKNWQTQLKGRFPSGLKAMWNYPCLLNLSLHFTLIIPSDPRDLLANCFSLFLFIMSDVTWRICYMALSPQGFPHYNTKVRVVNVFDVFGIVLICVLLYHSVVHVTLRFGAQWKYCETEGAVRGYSCVKLKVNSHSWNYLTLWLLSDSS